MDLHSYCYFKKEESMGLTLLQKEQAQAAKEAISASEAAKNMRRWSNQPATSSLEEMADIVWERFSRVV